MQQHRSRKDLGVLGTIPEKRGRGGSGLQVESWLTYQIKVLDHYGVQRRAAGNLKHTEVVRLSLWKDPREYSVENTLEIGKSETGVEEEEMGKQMFLNGQHFVSAQLKGGNTGSRVGSSSSFPDLGHRWSKRSLT